MMSSSTCPSVEQCIADHQRPMYIYLYVLFYPIYSGLTIAIPTTFCGVQDKRRFQYQSNDLPIEKSNAQPSESEEEEATAFEEHIRLCRREKRLCGLAYAFSLFSAGLALNYIVYYGLFEAMQAEVAVLQLTIAWLGTFGLICQYRVPLVDSWKRHWVNVVGGFTLAVGGPWLLIFVRDNMDRW